MDYEEKVQFYRGGDDPEGLLDDAFARWVRVWRARRQANRGLRALGTSFPQWRVLYATARLLRRDPQGVSELAVAQLTDMGVSTVSELFLRLERKGLVDRGQEDCDFSYHVLLTGPGTALLEDGLQEIRRFAKAITDAAGELGLEDAD